jgi:hypothetical protein
MVSEPDVSAIVPSNDPHSGTATVAPCLPSVVPVP